VDVIIKDQYTSECDTSGLLKFDVNDTFYYNNNMNLLIEMSYSCRTADYTSFYVVGELLANGSRRLFARNSTADIGSPDGGYRTDFKIDFNTTFNFTVDIGADGQIEFQNSTNPFPGHDLTFTQAARDYLLTAPVNFTTGSATLLSRCRFPSGRRTAPRSVCRT